MSAHIELIDRTQIPRPVRDDQAVDEAAAWLQKALQAGQAVVHRLEPHERHAHVTHTYRRAGLRLHLRVQTVSAGERSYTGRDGKTRTEPAVVYVMVLKPAATLERVG